MFLSAVFWVLPSITRGRMGQVGSACEEFKVSEGGVFWINVPESYGAGLPGLSR